MLTIFQEWLCSKCVLVGRDRGKERKRKKYPKYTVGQSIFLGPICNASPPAPQIMKATEAPYCRLWIISSLAMRCVALLTRAINELSLWDQSLSKLFGSLGLWKLIIPASLSTFAKMVLFTTKLDKNSSDSCKANKQHYIRQIKWKTEGTFEWHFI